MTNDSKYCKLYGDKFTMDCPNPSCDAWLIFFAKKGEQTPLFLRCVNSKKFEKGSCDSLTIFATRDSVCECCNKEIQQVLNNLSTKYYIFTGKN